MTESKKILLINDMPSYGNIATACALPILSQLGHIVCNLPTALVSNAFSYGEANILDTTSYMKNTLLLWQRFGFQFNAILTGFILCDEQAALIHDFCSKQSQKGVWIFVDPIMGDNGKLYKNIGQHTPMYMKKILATADISMPNYTEACLLTDTPWKKEGCSISESHRLIKKLKSLGSKSVIITSIPIENKPSVAGYNAATDQYFMLPYKEKPATFAGTGDLFASLVVGHFLQNKPLKQCIKTSIKTISKLIEKYSMCEDKKIGLPFDSKFY